MYLIWAGNVYQHSLLMDIVQVLGTYIGFALLYGGTIEDAH